jgi:hypothetical protein
LCRSTSQSSFHSYSEENEDVNNHDVLFGRLWCEFQGQIDLKHTQSNRRAVLNIKSPSWFASQSTKTADLFKYSGYVYDGIYFSFFFKSSS